MRSTSTSTPMPRRSSGTRPCPSRPSSTRASRCRAPSSARSGSESPGIVKFGSDASATLYARPMPLSSMPPHQTGIAVRRAEVVNGDRRGEAADAARLDVDDPPAPSVIMSSRAIDAVIDSSRQSGVCSRRCSSAWRTRSSRASGCSIMIRSNASSCARCRRRRACTRCSRRP